MTSLMITDDETILLQEADFPDNFIDKHHPDDFKPSKTAITEYYFHRLPLHNRLILRISIKISDNIYIPFTFICDTGAPSSLYINSLTRRLIGRRILEDIGGNQFININGRPLTVYPSPANHPDTNIIGLMALAYFGLIVQEFQFEFLNLPEYF